MSLRVVPATIAAGQPCHSQVMTLAKIWVARVTLWPQSLQSHFTS